MAQLKVNNPEMVEGDTTADALLKMGIATTPQHTKTLTADTNYTGVKLSSILFKTDNTTITSITAPNHEGSLVGESFPAGFLLPVACTQIEVSGGNAIGFKYDS